MRSGRNRRRGQPGQRHLRAWLGKVTGRLVEVYARWRCMGAGEGGVRHRILLPLFMSMVLFGSFTGCGPQEGAEEGAEKVEIRVVYSSGDVRWTGSMEWVARQFMEAHPGIQVTLTAPSDVEGQSFTDRLKALIAQDAFYDVVELREAAQFAEAGYLAPLPESLTGLIRPEDRVEDGYAIPRYTTTQGMIYDKGTFRRLGLSEPASYEAFLAVCERLQEARISPVAVGGADLWHMGFWGNYLYQNEILNEKGESDWSRERTVKMLEGFRLLREKGYIEARFSAITDSQTIHELSSGGAAMVYSGPWIIDQVTGLDPQMELGFFYLPGRDGKTRVEEDRSVTWSISRETAKDPARMEAAVAFLQFFYSQGIYEHVLAQMNAEPVTVRTCTGQETEAQQMVREAAREGMVRCDRLVGSEGTPDGFRSFYDQCLQEVLWGETPVEEIAGALEERWTGTGGQ